LGNSAIAQDKQCLTGALDICYGFGPWLATKNHVVALSSLSLLGWGGKWKEKGKKLLSKDKGSLTEQQTK